MMRHILTLILLLALPLSTRAEGIGRLFFSPQQRAQLDFQQAQTITNNGDSSHASSGLTVNGIVQKDGGSRTVWINGVPQSAGDSDERHPDSVPVSVPGKSNPIRMKVGQKLLPDDTPPQAPVSR